MPQISSNITIKKLNSNFLPEIINLGIECFDPSEDEIKRYWDTESWKKALENQYIILGAYFNKKLVGFILFGPKDNYCHCSRIAVRPKFRRLGIAKKLMSCAMRLAKDKGLSRFITNTIEEKFPAMFAYLTKSGFKIYKTEKVTLDGKKYTRSFFEKSLV